MPKLTDEQKTFVVQRLACFRPPTEILESVKEIWELELSRQLVHYYNPRAPASKTPKKWADIFEATREAFLESVADVGIANEPYRLEELQALYDKAKRSGNLKLASELLEQGAKETGGAFTNRQRLEHSGRVKTTGVLVFPATADSEAWSGFSRDQQRDLAVSAAEASERASKE